MQTFAQRFTKWNWLYIVALLWTLSPILVQAQKGSFHLGILNKLDYVVSSNLDKNRLFDNYGLIGQYQSANNIVVDLAVTHSIRAFLETEDGLRFASGNAVYVSMIEEKSVALENTVKYQFDAPKAAPYLGIGYTARFPYSIIGERVIVFDNDVDDLLQSGEELKKTPTFGVQIVTGLNFKLTDKLNLNLDLNYKLKIRSKLPTYGFPSIESGPLKNFSLLLGTGVLYRLSE